MKPVCMRIIVLALVLGGGAARAAEPDWSVYAALLKNHVHAARQADVSLNRVNYFAIKSDPRFAQVVSQIEQFPLAELNTQEEKLAFYINAYNVLAIRMVLDHWPLTSIKDAGSLLKPVWKKEAGRLGGQPVSLGEIEHEVLRPMGEPRMHMAIVCASVSCPDLRMEPYRAARLSPQLDDQARQFLANTAKGLVMRDGSAHVSKIFDWFSEDFTPQYGSVEGFIARYARLPAYVKLKADLPYNWSLNGE